MDNYEIKLVLKDKAKKFEKYLLSKKSKNLKDDDIKIYLLENKIIQHECYICKQKPFWNDKPLDLILDRKNNILTDNRIYNLRLLCPNCLFQFKTKKSIFYNKTKTTTRSCVECNKKIPATTSGKGNNKCVNYRCKDCLEKLATGFDLSQYEN